MIHQLRIYEISGITKRRSMLESGSSKVRFRTTLLGHEDQFRPPSLNGGCRLGKATIAGIGGKEEDAPIPAVHGTAIEPPGSTDSAKSLNPPAIGFSRAGWEATRFERVHPSAGRYCIRWSGS